MTTWRPVPGFEESHEVSPCGSVRSIARSSVDRIGRRYTVRSRIMKPDVDKDGYHIYRLRHKGRVWTVKGHRLVAMVFIGPCPEGMQVAHKDGRPSNNVLSNLRYDTCKGNHSDKYRHGTMPIGSRHGRAKITEKDALCIRNSNEKTSLLARAYGVAEVQIRRIRRRETWRHA